MKRRRRGRGTILTVSVASSPSCRSGPTARLGGSVWHGLDLTAAATFNGPFTVGHVIEPLTALPTDLASHDYVEQEFSASGTAHAFRG